jgi:PAS domain S-box-containing protein
MLNFTTVSQAMGPQQARGVSLKPYLAAAAALLLIVTAEFLLKAAGYSIPVLPVLLIPVLVGAGLGGFGAGMFALVLGVGAEALYFRDLPLRHFLIDGSGVPSPGAPFLAGGLAVCCVGQWLRHFGRKVRDAAERQQALEQEMARRRRLEEALLRSQRTVKAQLAEIEGIYATAPIGLCMVDRDLRLVRINRQLAALSGESPEDPAGRPLPEAMPEFGEVLMPLIRRVIVTGEPILEREVIGLPSAASADRVWLAGFVPLRDGDGQVAGVNIAIREVTEQKRFEAALRESEEKYRLLTELSPHAIWMTDPAGNPVYANRHWFEYTGLGLEEAQGQGWLSIVHPDDRAGVLERYHEALRDGSRLELELRLRCHKTGEYRWHILGALPLRGRLGLCTGWLGVSIDVHTIKSAEQAMKEAEESLREADRKKDEFLAILAHELRNPLAPILTSAQLLKRRGLERPDLLESATGSIERQVKHLSRLINDLSDISRIARGKVELHPEIIDLNTVIAQAVETCRPVVETHRQNLTVEGSGTHLRVRADPARLGQVVGNLLANATKFTPPEGKIRLSVGRSDGRAVISVRDDGIGIDTAGLDKIFEPFVQVERSVHREQNGLGIGLALAKRLMELHGGDIAVHSAGKGRGSEFTVRLPLVEEE